jgi:GNAT superfamily N-acetyltransferase
MIPLWRLTRNRHARRLYDGLAAVGVTATSMTEFEAEATDRDEPEADVAGPDDVTFVAAPAADDPIAGLDLDLSVPVSLLDGEWAVIARTADRVVGRALVSAGRHPYVEPLRTELSFDGAYVRRVFVDRSRRNEGIATRLVAMTRAVAGAAFAAETIHALVAADNIPSRRVFVSNGFRSVRRHDYVRVLDLEKRRVTDLER